MLIPDELRAQVSRTRAPANAYFAAAKISASHRVDVREAATWCEVIRRLDLSMLVALAEAFEDPLPFVGFVQVIRMHRATRDSIRLRDAESRVTGLAQQMLALQRLGSVVRVDDVVAATPRVVSVIRGELPEMVLSPRSRK